MKKKCTFGRTKLQALTEEIAQDGTAMDHVNVIEHGVTVEINRDLKEMLCYQITPKLPQGVR